MEINQKNVKLWHLDNLTTVKISSKVSSPSTNLLSSGEYTYINSFVSPANINILTLRRTEGAPFTRSYNIGREII